MEKEDLKQLLKKYQTGTIKKNDLVALLNYVAIPENESIIDQLLEELMEEMKEDTALPIASEKLYEHITTHPQFRDQPIRTLRRYYRWISATAAMLVLAGGVWWYTTLVPTNNKVMDNRQTIVSTVTSSPTDRLLLKTSTGKVIDLDNSTGDGTTGIAAAHFSDDGGLRYDKEGNVIPAEKHTIMTPKGRQYHITLSDGTRVWLNSATTMTFPARFQGDLREIKLDGEAYFEVQRAENWPFVVHANQQKIEVLGTHFNVNTYREDKITYTTLLEGKVSVSTASQEKILRPGQQATTTAQSHALEVKNIEAKDVLAWKDKMFVFNNEEIQQVMRQVSRWYDVEVIYLNGMEGKRIGGSIPRFENVEELMEALQATGLLQYQMKGGQIIIKE